MCQDFMVPSFPQVRKSWAWLHEEYDSGEYYASEGAGHALQIAIPVGQYVPVFQAFSPAETGASAPAQETAIGKRGFLSQYAWLFWVAS
jgi:hypothetical protein